MKHVKRLVEMFIYFHKALSKLFNGQQIYNLVSFIKYRLYLDPDMVIELYMGKYLQ